jgi:phage gp29-like protein
MKGEKKLRAFVKSLPPRQRVAYVRAVQKELANAYGEGFMSRGATPPLKMVGDVLGIFTGGKAGNTPMKSGAMTPIGIPPQPPFSPEQWMTAAAAAAWQKFPERAASVGLNPPPYPTASAQIEGQVAPSEPTHTKSVVSAQRVLQYLLARFNPIRGLTPQRLGNYLEQWSLGFLRWEALAWSQIRERDDDIKAVETKRILAVAKLPYEIVKDDDSPEAEQHKQALEAAYKGITCTDALDQNTQGDIQLLMRQMMEAIGAKFSVHEIVWKPDVQNGKDTLTAHFRHVPTWFFENRTGQLRYLPYELALDGIPLDAGGWLITVGDGLNFVSSIAYIYKQLGLKAWANFVDKYGMPFIHAKTDAAYGSPEWDQMVSAVGCIRSDGSLVTNLAGQLEALKVDTTGSSIPQEAFCDRMGRAIARVWMGGDLSTHSRGGSGGVGALPQIAQQEELTEADAVLLSNALHFYFDRWVIRYLFGTAQPLARFKITVPPNIDTAKEVAVDQFLLGCGVSIAKDDLRKRYSRRDPDAGEELATPPAPAGDAQLGKGLGDGSPTGPLTLGNVQLNYAAFKRQALRELSLAQARALEPLRKRIVAAAAIENDEQRQAELVAIKKDLPIIFSRVSDESGELISKFEAIIGTSLVSGAVEAAAYRS